MTEKKVLSVKFVRKSWVIAILVLLGTVFAFKYISSGKKNVAKSNDETSKVVFVSVVKNQSLPLVIEATGQLKSKNTFDLYSEVTGVLKPGAKEFRTGTIYRRGELIIRVDDTEAKAKLYSQRSDFQNLITRMIPDIKIEFPESFDKWEKYLSEFEIEKNIKDLPKLSSNKEKYFVSGKNIYTQFYAIKNLEAGYAKYRLYAPFNGIVTEAKVNPGGLIRSGQKVGVFSNMDVFELEVSVKAEDAKHLKIGDEVEIYSPDNMEQSTGKIIRINGAIDLNTQTVSVFIETRDKHLKAGMYLNVKIKTIPVNGVSSISREILHNNTFVYLVKDSVLVEYKIHPLKFNEKSIIVDNLKDGDVLVIKSVSGGYPGMKVNPKQNNE